MSRSLLLCAVLAFACLSFASGEFVNVTYANMIPEGIEFHNGEFFVSSIAFGTVFKVTTAGVATPFVVDNRLVSSAGLQVDAARNYLYIANTNFTRMSLADPTGFQSSLVVANLATGAVVKYIDLSAVSANLSIPRLANDVTFDTNGHLYVTDSLGNQVWKIDGTTDVATTFVHDDRFQGSLFNGVNYLGPNGIEYHNGYLIVIISGTAGKIFKVPIVSGVAGTVTQVSLGVDGNNNLDGMIFYPGQDMFFVINNNAGTFYNVHSEDNFTTATSTYVATSPYLTPTSVTLNGTMPYVVCALGFQLKPWYPIFSVEMAPTSAAVSLSLSGLIPLVSMIIVLALL